MNPEREKGQVVAYDFFKGFGFIRRDKGKDVFFFYNEIETEEKVLDVGDFVSFEVRKMNKGPRAYSIKKLADGV